MKPNALDNEPTCKRCECPLTEEEIDADMTRCEECDHQRYLERRDEEADRKYDEMKDEGLLRRYHGD